MEANEIVTALTDWQLVRLTLERLHWFGILAECTCDEPIINWNGAPCASCQIEMALAALDRLEGQEGQEPSFPADALTPEQFRTISAIQKFTSKHHYSPTLRELQDLLDLSSTSVVDQRLSTLEQRGYITREKGKSRTIRVIAQA